MTVKKEFSVNLLDEKMGATRMPLSQPTPYWNERSTLVQGTKAHYAPSLEGRGRERGKKGVREKYRNKRKSVR